MGKDLESFQFVFSLFVWFGCLLVCFVVVVAVRSFCGWGCLCPWLVLLLVIGCCWLLFLLLLFLFFLLLLVLVVIVVCGGAC